MFPITNKGYLLVDIVIHTIFSSHVETVVNGIIKPAADLNLDDYEWFTDIEFNLKKSINCQARSAAIYKLLQKNNLWDCLNNIDSWKKFHMKHVVG